MNAIIETKGMEARIAPQKLLRLAISEIAKINNAEEIIFMT